MTRVAYYVRTFRADADASAWLQTMSENYAPQREYGARELVVLAATAAAVEGLLFTTLVVRRREFRNIPEEEWK